MEALCLDRQNDVADWNIYKLPASRTSARKRPKSNLLSNETSSSDALVKINYFIPLPRHRTGRPPFIGRLTNLSFNIFANVPHIRRSSQDVVLCRVQENRQGLRKCDRITFISWLRKFPTRCSLVLLAKAICHEVQCWEMK